MSKDAFAAAVNPTDFANLVIAHRKKYRPLIDLLEKDESHVVAFSYISAQEPQNYKFVDFLKGMNDEIDELNLDPDSPGYMIGGTFSVENWDRRFKGAKEFFSNSPEKDGGSEKYFSVGAGDSSNKILYNCTEFDPKRSLEEIWPTLMSSLEEPFATLFAEASTKRQKEKVMAVFEAIRIIHDEWPADYLKIVDAGSSLYKHKAAATSSSKKTRELKVDVPKFKDALGQFELDPAAF